MLFRLVRPMRRKGSLNSYFVQRIPADVVPRVARVRLAIPLGDNIHEMTLRANQKDVRFSLRTAEPGEVKRRQAQAAAYMETVWQGLRTRAEVSLTHRQATALAGEFYHLWANESDRERTLALEQAEPRERRTWNEAAVSAEEEEGYWEAIEEHLDAVKAANDAPLENSGEPTALEKRFGPVINRKLSAKGIFRLDAASREMLLEAFWLAFKDAAAKRKRNAQGDYSPDPKASRFPQLIVPERTGSLEAPRQPVGSSLSGLVEAWWVEAQATGRKPSTHDSYECRRGTGGKPRAPAPS